MPVQIENLPVEWNKRASFSAQRRERSINNVRIGPPPFAQCPIAMTDLGRTPSILLARGEGLAREHRGAARVGNGNGVRY